MDNDLYKFRVTSGLDIRFSNIKILAWPWLTSHEPTVKITKQTLTAGIPLCYPYYQMALVQYSTPSNATFISK